MAAADGGQVLAADLVEAPARGRGGHEYRPVGELALKGLPEPVRTVEVVWVPATAGPGATAPPFPPLLHDERSISFVGRPDAVEQLTALWKEAATGQRRCALLAGEPVHGDPQVERHRMFEATTSWLAAAAEPAGLVLVLDDLHWAGKPTLLPLRHLLRSPDLGRALVIGTYRDTDLDRTHPLGELLADLRREPGVERLSLAGLTGEEVEAFLVAASGEELDDDKRALAAAVHAETEGNAFFVGEVLRHLAESGAIVQRDGRWQAVVALDDMAIPEGVREVIGRRVSRLSGPVNDVLRWAAVVGRDVEFGVLADVVEGSEDDLLGALDEAVDACLVEEVGADRYRFVHALVR